MKLVSVILILLTFNLIRVDSLHCYQCTSLNNTACGDPFGAFSTITECPPIETREAILCRKLRQTVDTPNGKIIRITRSCGYIPNAQTERDESCFRASFTAQSSSRYCACKEDSCNSSNSIRAYSLAVSVIAILVYMMM